MYPGFFLKCESLAEFHRDGVLQRLFTHGLDDA